MASKNNINKNSWIKQKEGTRAQKIQENLTKLIKAHGLSYRGLFQATGITQPHLSRLAHAKHASPGLEVLDTLSKFFGISVSQLIGDQEINFKNLPELVYPKQSLEKKSKMWSTTKKVATESNQENEHPVKLQS